MSEAYCWRLDLGLSQFWTQFRSRHIEIDNRHAHLLFETTQSRTVTNFCPKSWQILLRSLIALWRREATLQAPRTPSEWTRHSKRRKRWCRRRSSTRATASRSQQSWVNMTTRESRCIAELGTPRWEK